MSGENILFVKIENNQNNADEANNPDNCVCSNRVSLDKMRPYIGKYFLKNKVPVYGCGFCG